jgi:hypothetical protein
MKVRRKNKSLLKVGTSGRWVSTMKEEMRYILWMCFVSIYENRRLKLF